MERLRDARNLPAVARHGTIIHMQQFTDTKGRTWQLELNGLTLKRVKDDTNLLLTSICDDDCRIFAELVGDPLLLISVLWSMVRCSDAAKDVDEQSFSEGFAGKVLTESRKALIEETLDFSDDPALRRLIEKATEIGSTLKAKASKVLEEMDAEQTASSIIDLYSSSPRFAESSHGRSHLAN